MKKNILDKVAIAILNWNGQKLLEQFLPSVVAHSAAEGVRIYIIDNGSTDNSLDYLKVQFPEVEVIALKKNWGFPAGYNKGLEQIESEYYLILNNDVEVSPGWLNPLIELMDSDDTIAAIQPKILSYQQRDEFEYAGAAGGFIDKYGFPFCRGRLLNVFEKDLGQYNFTDEIFWATGACMLVRSSLYKKYGGMDEAFFAHMEEIDLCWRLKNAGYKIMYNGNSSVYHLGGGTLNRMNPFKTYLNFRNNLYLLYKNLPKGKVHRILFARYFLDMIASAKFLFGLEFGSYWAVIRAHYSFWTTRRQFKEKRKYNLSVTTKVNHYEMYDGLIVYDFFVRRKKNFTQLRPK